MFLDFFLKNDHNCRITNVFYKKLISCQPFSIIRPRFGVMLNWVFYTFLFYQKASHFFFQYGFILVCIYYLLFSETSFSSICVWCVFCLLWDLNSTSHYDLELAFIESLLLYRPSVIFLTFWKDVFSFLMIMQIYISFVRYLGGLYKKFKFTTLSK